jgi:hypothetical protein
MYASCLPLGFGDDVTFTFNHAAPLAQQKSVSFSHLSSEFETGRDGEGYLSFLGMDRIETDESLPTLQRLALGGAIVKAPPYRVLYRYQFRLRLLTKQKYDDFEKIITAHRAALKTHNIQGTPVPGTEGLLIRLDDRRLKITDYTTKLRATATGAAAATTFDGFVSYYPALLLWIPRITSRSYKGHDLGKLEFEAFEYGAALTP